MSIWNPIDRLGHWIATSWTPLLQVRSGTVCTLGGIVLGLYGPWSGEQFLIYEMSAVALILAGLGILVTAVLAVNEDPDSDPEELLPDD
jgi:hypothetical protein